MLGRCRDTLANVACVAGGGGGWRPLLNRPLACILCRPTPTECAEHCAEKDCTRQLRRSELPLSSVSSSVSSPRRSPTRSPFVAWACDAFRHPRGHHKGDQAERSVHQEH